MLVDTLYIKNSSKFRDSLKVIICILPTVLSQSIIDAKIANIAWIGCLFMALQLTFKGHMEFAGGFYALALNINTAAFWVLPILGLYLLIQLFRNKERGSVS